MWPEIVTFDCHGTPVRWPETLRSVFDSLLPPGAGGGARFHADSLAIVSNTEDALIAETVRGLGVALEVVTAEQARAYKPDPRFFAFAVQRLGVSRGGVLHVGAHWATDLVPAFELGLARVWINRRRETANPAMPPSAELPDLSGLEATIRALASNARA